MTLLAHVAVEDAVRVYVERFMGQEHGEGVIALVAGLKDSTSTAWFYPWR